MVEVEPKDSSGKSFIGQVCFSLFLSRFLLVGDVCVQVKAPHLPESAPVVNITTTYPPMETSYLRLCTHLTIIFFSSGLCLDSGQFTPALALYDPFGVDVPLNVDITHSPVQWSSCA